MNNLLSIIALLAMLAACAKLTVDSIDKTQAERDRAELVRCQNMDAGWADACRHVQQVRAEYKQTTLTTLGGQQ